MWATGLWWDEWTQCNFTIDLPPLLSLFYSSRILSRQSTFENNSYGETSMTISHYHRAWRDIAFELTEFLSTSEKKEVVRFLEKHSLLEAWSSNGTVRIDDYNRVVRYLDKGPKELRLLWAKTPREERIGLWLQLQFLVLRAAKAVEVAEVTELVVGMPYRKSLRRISEQLIHNLLEPTTEDVLDLLQ
jgi:hypothetical protein